jgi:lipopolysaccharide transport system ATP-binding protein
MLGKKAASNGSDTIWALKDICCEVKRGEVVGVIGRNGAGKSTLLKILSRITEPTSGYAVINGRVGSLLEVGTGFHFELTGRENIYLNGAILGMSRSEIDRKFDEIVEFSEVGKFIDTPVKHYSSGMHLRLAFSVAAHLEPEILLVDEVLAVGDASFQKKCLGKMEDVAAHGRTVLFVSHNLGAVQELCQTSLVLKNGMVDFRGTAVDGLAHYCQSFNEDPDDFQPSETICHSIRLNGSSDGVGAEISGGSPFFVEGRLHLHQEYANVRMFCMINDYMGESVIHDRIDNQSLGHKSLQSGSYRFRVDFPILWLAPGVYTMHFKFIGRDRSGRDVKCESERAIINVTGKTDGLSRAKLAPAANWTLTAEEDSLARAEVGYSVAD